MAWTVRAAALGVLIGVFVCGSKGRAADFTWSATPGSGLWTSAVNWSPDTGPPSIADKAFFNASAVTSISLGGPGVNSIQFNTGAPAYSFSLTGPATFTISGDIVNNSSNRPTFTLSATSPNLANVLFAGTAANAIIVNNSGGNTEFVASGTAANATITNHTGGETQFLNNATAGNATISNDTVGTSTTFSGNSTAGNATITSSTLGTTTFIGASTAGTAHITNNFLGFTVFEGSSTAGSATITSNANGLTEFENSSSGGLAQLITNAMGVVDISPLATPGMTVGSIAGAVGGTYELGSKTLTVGGNNASTTVSGTIQDGGAGGGIGGALIKVGTGTLTLTGTNTYSGGTSFDEGTVAVISDSNLGTGALTFDGGALEALAAGGGISSSKTVTLNAGGGTFLADSGTTSSLSGTISGTGSFTKDGAGTLILSGMNTYSGATNVAAGTLQAGSATALSANSAFTVTSLLDLHGFSNTIGSLSGNGTVTNNGAARAVLTVGNANTSTTFGGLLEDGPGPLGLTKTGTGTLILVGTNTYSGGTTITGGTLQLGNGGTTGSIVGNVTDNGSLAFDRSNSLTFNSLINGSGTVVQNGPGTIILGGTNTYTGGTVINNGTLLVNNAQALGLGNVVVNGGILGADPQPINVKGNYTQNAGGTLQLRVAGGSPGRYDTLKVGGNAALGGTLQLISLGFQPKAGDQLTLVTTGGVVSGRFAQFLDPFVAGPGFSIVDLIYGQNSVLLEFLNFTSFALTPNEQAAANLLDAVHLDPRAANLISFLDAEPVSNLPGALAQISPDALTSFYEITFSNANIQRLNIEGRLDDLRAGSTGFSSNMNVTSPPANPEGKGAIEGKSAKNPVEQAIQPAPENRWGIWVTGFGDFVNVDGDYNAHGYDFTTGGFTVGVDYRLTGQFAIGAMSEYAHTWTSLNPSGSIDVNSGRGGVYATWFSHGFYLAGAVYGGGDVYSSGRATLGGMANGSTSGAEYSAFMSAGYDFHCGQLTIGPTAALQYTYINIDSFDENGSLAPLNIHTQSAESLRTDFFARASYLWQVGNVLLEPSLRAAWEHEYKYSDLPITASFAGIPGPSATFFGPSEGHDSAIVSAGVSVHWTPAIATYVNYDGQLGRNLYDSNAVTGGVRISF